ncbi:alpha/beta hydrolase family protein [Novosphingobium acidiphilum]|uniref:alpha/beta hydrolase family protein n=1 Tax=Novosphingobium acidiphilum TaxID=505248 RepID=UPI00041F7498|nr:S9 family peptidase [Novosphingobium acidiphilum]
MSIVAIALALAAAQPAAPAPVAQTRRTFAGLTMAPAGDRLAVIEADQVENAAAEPHKRVVLRSALTGAVLATHDPCATCDYQDPAFSPDGHRIAFLARDRKAGTTTLWLATDGVLAARTMIQGVAGRPRFSPDGKTLAMLAVVGAHKDVGATQAAAPQVGEIGESFDEQRIMVIPVEGDAVVRTVSPADTFVYEYDWTPDGRGFVATAAKGDGDNNWWIATLDRVDLASGTLTPITAPKDQLNYPRMSPDGNAVAYIGGIMSDFGSVGGDLWLVPATGGAARNLTPGFAGSFTSLMWRGNHLVATALVGDRMTILSVDPATGKTGTLWSAPATIRAGDANVALDARGDRAAALIEDYAHAQDITAGPIGKLGVDNGLTHANAALVAAGTARSVIWTSDGRSVQGWLLAPARIEPGKTYPMVVEVHGGPSAASTPAFFANDFRGGLARKLLEKGYFVFFPNPRGSYGQGEAFTRANVRDFGGGDLRDILAGIDAVEKIAPVDDRRLGLFGHSYGGFMAMWTVTHSQRFHAVVAGAGIANWISYYGENGIDRWMIPFFGASAYDDPAIYRQLSPLETIKQARTPTFIYVGERDVECPTPQSVEFWHALNAMGVKNKLLILEGEGHGIRKPEHVRQVNDGALGWFDTYLKAG